MNEYKDILMKSKLFEGIAEENLGSLLRCLNGKVNNYKKNEFIFMEGDIVNNAAILLDGKIEISKENLSGNKSIIKIINPSEIFGEVISCTERKNSTVNVMACEDSTVLRIDFNRIISGCSNSCSFHIKLISNMFKIIAEKNVSLNRKIDYLLLKGMREKISMFLLSNYKTKKSLSFNLSFNRNEMADYLNVSRSSMCRELSKMKEEGIIDFYKDSFKILDIEQLRRS